ncbi:phosphotransferase family protein [Parendozoicomonas haliclonae]|uniref:Phosphotransferase enzyme family protein n=1 Tax=Parendozoicomonas haliclonae TaxID=1960125 RepID=A0A1X7AI05_9GAMM|nr:phosphotransferase family protein [Parendozoicomonas haliclonae]SMA42709.1 Phosphotransferase enzyme family protein [Parendozoicomonas haliclonae]
MSAENKTLVDQPGDVRSGEELDLAALDAYIQQQLPEAKGELHVRQFPGGASNLTYLVSKGSDEWILRRPPFGVKAASAHDMSREYRVMSALQDHYPVPKMIAFCEDQNVLGCDFYLMERLNGIIPRTNLPKGMTLSEQKGLELCMNVLRKFSELHNIDINQAGLTELGKGSGYVRRQIEGWSGRFRKSKTENVPDFEAVMSWLDSKQPDDVGTCLIHNDFRFDNVVLNPDNPMEVIGVLDWEMCTLGDPLMDLGNSLAYWIEADDEPPMQMFRRQPTNLPGMLTRKEVVEWYCQENNIELKSFDFYEVYGLFRLAVIMQQIYYRFHHGQTQDKRFAMFPMAITYLEQRCLRLIKSSQI